MTVGAGARSIRALHLLAVVAVLVLATSAFASAWAQVGPFGGIRSPPAGGIGGWIVAKQALFYRTLAGLIRAAKTDGWGYWGLMGVSFLYGIFHAAGPGHGKAVISSYLVANEETWRRGIVLSFASALLQALTAVVLVAIAAVLIGATAKMMGDTVKVIEIISYTLIVLLGARLVWVKGRGFVHALRELRWGAERATKKAPCHAAHGQAPDCHPDHSGAPAPEPSDAQRSPAHAGGGHTHGHSHGRAEGVLPWRHAHAPEPEELAGPGGWRRGLSAIVAVGLRPCSGAILVLVFALAQGLFWAGIASTFVMGLGTALTVAAIATLAVAGKALAKRFAAARSGYGALMLRGVEVAAAALVMACGAFLLTGYIASERMGMF